MKHNIQPELNINLHNPIINKKNQYKPTNISLPFKNIKIEMIGESITNCFLKIHE